MPEEDGSGEPPRGDDRRAHAPAGGTPHVACPAEPHAARLATAACGRCRRRACAASRSAHAPTEQRRAASAAYPGFWDHPHIHETVPAPSRRGSGKHCARMGAAYAIITECRSCARDRHRSSRSPPPRPARCRGGRTRSRASRWPANQRWRLVDGMIDTVGEKGYAATTVSDVIGRAGSRARLSTNTSPTRRSASWRPTTGSLPSGMRAIAEAFHRGGGLRRTRARRRWGCSNWRSSRSRTRCECDGRDRRGRPARGSSAANSWSSLRGASCARAWACRRGPARSPTRCCAAVVGGCCTCSTCTLRRGERTTAAQASCRSACEWAHVLLADAGRRS